MRKIILLLLIAFFIFSCKKQDGQPVAEEEIKFKEITAKVELPTNSSINPNDLKISTILTENSQVVNSNSKIQTFDTDAIELAFATNSQGNIVLLSYFDPVDGDAIQLNVENTAIALVMLHPWTVDLSVSAKKEASVYIKNLPEYSALKQSIENSIVTGEIDPLAASDVIAKLNRTQKRVSLRISEYKEPLQFDIDPSKITIQNTNSSAVYSVGLYGSNGKLIENKLVGGLTKSQYTMNQFFTNKELYTDIPEVTFKTPVAEGSYLLKAKSGLSFDNSTENSEAAFENSKILLSNIIGIFSSKLKAIVRLKDGKCGAEIGAKLYNGISGPISIEKSLKEFSKSEGNPKDKVKLLKNVFYFVKDGYDGIVKLINSCSSNPYNIKNLPFRTFFRYLELLSNLENAFNGGAHLADWLQYDKSIEMCFQKNINDVQSCKPYPASIEIHSGNNQTGPNLTKLPKPLVVIVKDENGLPISGVSVSWLLGSGSGSYFYNIGTNVEVIVSPTITKVDGTAGVDVLLNSGNPRNNDNVTARVERKDGSPIEVVFSITVIR